MTCVLQGHLTPKTCITVKCLPYTYPISYCTIIIIYAEKNQGNNYISMQSCNNKVVWVESHKFSTPNTKANAVILGTIVGDKNLVIILMAV